MNKNQILLRDTIQSITPLDETVRAQAQERMDSLIKPLGSLGKLEEIAVRLAGITGKIKNEIHQKTIVILCSDNGVVEEGVASSPQAVTFAQTVNFARGLTGVAVLAKHQGAKLMIVDVGVNAVIQHPDIINKKIRPSTSNIIKGMAMSRDEARQAIAVGIEAAKDAIAKGADLLGVGEMGIGNTTTSSAVLIALTGCAVDKAVGKGGGLTDAAFLKKKLVVSKALEVNVPDPFDPIDVLSKVGGFDIGAMVGVYLGAAAMRVPVVIDGFISMVAALLASKLCPTTKDYMFASHCSYEAGYQIASAALGLEPMLNLDMRLGEGSGCPLAFSIMESACAVMNNMATFAEGEIDTAYLAEITKECF